MQQEITVNTQEQDYIRDSRPLNFKRWGHKTMRWKPSRLFESWTHSEDQGNTRSFGLTYIEARIEHTEANDRPSKWKGKQSLWAQLIGYHLWSELQGRRKRYGIGKSCALGGPPVGKSPRCGGKTLAGEERSSVQDKVDLLQRKQRLNSNKKSMKILNRSAPKSHWKTDLFRTLMDEMQIVMVNKVLENMIKSEEILFLWLCVL